MTGTPTITYIHPDHLGSTAVETDDTGAVTKTLDYYPYGATRVSSGSSLNKRDYIGQFSDDSGLSYLNARYYDSNRGQFTSEDPVFWEIGLTQDGKNALANPQSQNSYAYGNGNPIVNKDPLGRIAGIDDAYAFVAGGIVGLGSYGAVARASGSQVTLGGAAGAFLSGGILSVGIWDAPTTGGASAALALRLVAALGDGIAAGAVNSTAQQYIDYSSGAQQQRPSFDQVATEGLYTGAVNAVTRGFIRDARVPRFSSGPGNMQAMGRTMNTKYSNGTASFISPSTAFRSAVGSQAASTYQILAGMAADLTRALATLRSFANSSSKSK